MASVASSILPRATSLLAGLPMTRTRLALACLLAWLLAAPLAAKEPVPPASGTGVVGVEEAQLRPEYWLARLPAPDDVLLTPAQIAAQNAELLRVDPSMHELAALPPQVAQLDVELEAAAQRLREGDRAERMWVDSSIERCRGDQHGPAPATRSLLLREHGLDRRRSLVRRRRRLQPEEVRHLLVGAVEAEAAQET